jgi:hypothetical protein
MSLKSELTADDDMVVLGVNAACGSVYTPLPFLGIVYLSSEEVKMWYVLQIVVFFTVVIYYLVNDMLDGIPLGHLALFAVIITFLVTVILSKFLDLLRWLISWCG